MVDIQSRLQLAGIKIMYLNHCTGNSIIIVGRKSKAIDAIDYEFLG